MSQSVLAQQKPAKVYRIGTLTAGPRVAGGGARLLEHRFARGVPINPGEHQINANELVVTGSHRRLADAIGFMQKRKLGEVPSFVRDWRARDDSNVRPLPSEGSTLSS
jgi:hypothetical protein